MTAAVATIDLAAYRRNLTRVGSAVAPATVMAVVKADAYGHGLLPIARSAIAAGVNWLGALDVRTALALRSAGIDDETAIFAWLLVPDEHFREAIEARIDLGISTLEQLESIADAAASVPARVHLKIDTGLHRNGASAADWPDLVRRAVSLESAGLVDLVGVWTHIAEASDAEDSEAIRRFHDAIGAAQALGAAFEVRHLAASAASLARPDARFDLVRIGAFAYGIAPGGGVGPAELGLEPVMTLRSVVLSVTGSTAEVGIGFRDGISTAAAGAVSVAIAGDRCAVVEVRGDRLSIAVEPGRVHAGDTVVLFGGGGEGEATLQEWADALDTIGEEIVTRLTDRVRREYV
jgi:alanine racemase